MGANLCSLRQPNSVESKRNSGSSSIFDFVKPECLKSKKKVVKIDKKNLEEKKHTLEECLIASPGHALRPDCIISGELFVFKHFSKRVHPSNPKRDSFTLERPLKNDGEEFDEVGSLSRSQSGKLKKRVSFSDKADVVIFYSPDERFDDDAHNHDDDEEL